MTFQWRLFVGEEEVERLLNDQGHIKQGWKCSSTRSQAESQANFILAALRLVCCAPQYSRVTLDHLSESSLVGMGWLRKRLPKVGPGVDRMSFEMRDGDDKKSTCCSLKCVAVLKGWRSRGRRDRIHQCHDQHLSIVTLIQDNCDRIAGNLAIAQYGLVSDHGELEETSAETLSSIKR